MKYLIIDWMSNICFKSDLDNFIDFDAASEALDHHLLQLHGEDCDLETERDEYTITPFENNDKIMNNVLYQFN